MAQFSFDVPTSRLEASGAYLAQDLTFAPTKALTDRGARCTGTIKNLNTAAWAMTEYEATAHSYDIKVSPF